MFSIGSILLHLSIGDIYPFEYPAIKDTYPFKITDNPRDKKVELHLKVVPEVFRGLINGLLNIGKNPHDRIKLSKFGVEIRMFKSEHKKQNKKYENQHVVTDINGPNKLSNKHENTIMAQSKFEGVSNSLFF